MEKLTVVQSSMQFSDRKPDISADCKALMEQARDESWDIIALSETVKGNQVFGQMRHEVHKARWWFQGGIRGDVRFIVNPKHELMESGYAHVLDGRKQKRGSFSARGVAEVTFRTPGGNIVTDHTTHWITGYKLGPKGNPQREAMFDQQTEAIIERVKLHGKGRRLSFWQGDTNLDEFKDRGGFSGGIHKPFRQAGLRSVYDELNEYPTTHGKRKTIDVIGHYLPDTRVTAKDVRVLPRNGRNVDHLIVVATYHIRTPH